MKSTEEVVLIRDNLQVFRYKQLDFGVTKIKRL